MMKIRIETANIENRESHSCEIVDSTYGPDSTVYEFIALFIRAVQGMSFLEDQVRNAIIGTAEDLKDEIRDKKSNRQNIPDVNSNYDLIENDLIEDDTQA